jgi:hypothetical protein
MPLRGASGSRDRSEHLWIVERTAFAVEALSPTDPGDRSLRGGDLPIRAIKVVDDLARPDWASSEGTL